MKLPANGRTKNYATEVLGLLPRGREANAPVVAMRMTPGREVFWIRILISFHFAWFLSVLAFLCVGPSWI